LHHTNHTDDEPPAPDVALARRIGAYLRGEAPLQPRNGTDEALVEALNDYRTDLQVAHEGLSPGASDRIWQRVARETGISAQEQKAKIFTLSSARTAMAVAASVLLAGVLAFLLLQSPQPEVVAASDASTVTYTDDDGTRITLRPHSQLVKHSADAAHIRYGVEGEAYFEVAAGERAVEVDAKDGRVQVLGTTFTVRTWGDAVEVYLAEGRLAFQHPPSGATQTLAPGERVRLYAEGALSGPEAADAAYYIGWIENELLVEEREVRLVLAELEQHHNIKFAVPEELMEQTLTGRILLDSVDQSLSDLGLVLGGTFTQTDDQRYTFEAH